MLEVDPEKRRVALGLKQLEADPWKTDIPARYHAGDIVRGIITKLTSFGAFVELEDGLEGLLHISELSEKKIPSPEEIVDVGDVVDVRVIRVDPDSRKIGLSLRTEGPIEDEEEQPRIVVRSDELEKVENPQELIDEVLEEGRQHERERAEAAAPVSEGPKGATTSLNIPASVVGAAEPEAEEPAEPRSKRRSSRSPRHWLSRRPKSRLSPRSKRRSSRSAEPRPSRAGARRAGRAGGP